MKIRTRMFMMRKLLFFFCLLFSGYAVYSQDSTADTSLAQDTLFSTTAQEEFKRVSVVKFEDDGFWRGYMSSDDGIIRLGLFPGGPLEKEPLPGESENGIAESDDMILGAKVDFLRRGSSEFTIIPARPIPIEGITKTVSVWVAGRNTNHVLKLLIRDHFGNKTEVYMGKLNFLGWKELTATIPPTVKQRDYHYIKNGTGIMVEGLKVECASLEAYGTFFLYLDDMRAYTDLFGEKGHATDDPDDGLLW